MCTEWQNQIEPGWRKCLAEEFQQQYMADLKDFLRRENSGGKMIFPSESQYFEAFNSTPIDKVKVIMLGQDPYHGPGQAHGLCFSVPKGVRNPPSLRNISKEIQCDFQLSPDDFGHGNLQSWADQGVLLLNSVLTVEAGRAASHKGKGWERLTDRAIVELSEKKDHLVFMLWGAYAQTKGAIIDESRHLVLRAPHPSPLSAHRGFLGCRHFSMANAHLNKHGKASIDWGLP